jgi:hypothetical protein
MEADDQRPAIELFMYSLNQEFPVGKGHGHFLRRMATTKPDAAGRLQRLEQVESEVFRLPAGDWAAQWLSNEWIENHTQAAGIGLQEEIDPMERAILREEDFGGLLFDPQSDRVFRLNHAGYRLFEEMRGAYQQGSRDLHAHVSEQFDAADVKHFAAYLEGAGIWLRS